MRRRVMKPTRLKLSEITDKESLNGLVTLFTEFEVQRQISVSEHRKAVEARSEEQIALHKTQQLQQRFLQKAAQHFPEVANEPVWFIFRKGDEIILESVMTERTQRNMVRAQLKQIDDQIESGDSNGTDGMFESDEDDNNEQEAEG